jgi:hypothetical protein
LGRVRLRDVQSAAFAGGGVNAVVPARGGDIVKILLIRRRAPDAGVPMVLSTLVAESVVESLAGAALLVWALSQGLFPSAALTAAFAGAAVHPVLAAMVVLGVAGGIVVAGAVMRRRARRVYRELVAGTSVLRRPRVLARVAGWQLAGRAVRLGAIGCCLSAWGLPGGAGAAALAMAIDGGTRVHFAPATAGLRVGLLAYGLPAVTGTAVSLGAVIAYLAGMRLARTLLSLAIAAVVLVSMLASCSPRRLLEAARRLPRAAAEPLSHEPSALAVEPARRTASL